MPKLSRLMAMFAPLLFCLPVLGHERLLSVSGYGEVEIFPDLIRIDFSVSHSSRTSIAAAKAQMDETSSRVAAVLIQNDVDEEDIVSTALNVWEGRDYNKCEDPHPVYRASRDVQVTIRDVDRYSSVIQALVDGGVTQIHGVQSGIADRAAVRRTALARAVAEARRTAGLLADEMGIAIGEVHQIGDSQTGHQIGRAPVEEFILKSATPEELRYEFEPQPVTVSQRVNVEYVIE